MRATRAKVARELRRFIERELLDGVPATDDPLRDGQLDSLAVEHLIRFLEERYGLSLGDEDMSPERFESLDAAADLVLSRLPAGAR